MRYVILAGTHEAAREVCREWGLAVPPHRVEGAEVVIFTVKDPDRIRGFMLREDDKVLHGYYDPHLRPANYAAFDANLKAIEQASGQMFR